MKDKIITKKDLDENNSIDEIKNDDGCIIFEKNLGLIKIKKSIVCKFSIFAKAGNGIEAGDGIKAGRGIEAGDGIKAGRGIEAGDGIKAGRGIKAGDGIKAGRGIKAGWGIEAGNGIEAGWGIEAGDGIEAGWGIITLLSGGIIASFISCLRVAVGFHIKEEQEIKTEVRRGTVVLGRVEKPC